MGQNPIIEFSRTLCSITLDGTLHSTVSVLGIRPPDCVDSQWIIDWFAEVDHELKIQISLLYEEDVENASSIFNMSACAINTEADGFVISEALAEEYSLPFAEASSEWKEMVRFYREGTLGEEERENFMIDIGIAQMLDGRKVFIGNNGYCGLVADHAELGDLICVLFGCDVPVVLRQEDDHYIFIGECCVQELMHSEAIKSLQRGDVKK